MPITHSFVSAKSDGGDATLVRPVDWNDDHVGRAVFAGARATKGATQSINSSTETAVTFPGTDTFDTDAYHDPAGTSTRMTVPSGKDGYYSVHAVIEFAANATGFRYLMLKKNGSVYSYGAQLSSPGGTDGVTLEASWLIQLAATDYVEVFASQASGSPLNVAASCFFEIALLGT